MSLRKLLDLTGKVALVTGGSRGLGLQIASGLGEMGAKLALTARKVDELEEARATLAREHVDALPVVCDLSQTTAVEAWQKLVNLNLTGTFLVTQSVGRRSMIPRRYGRIVNVASVAGLQGSLPERMRSIAYNTTKGGVVNFTRALAGEWGQYGITVNAI